MRNYLILIEKAQDNYSAYSPDVDGCIATGKTEEEARKNFVKALEMHIEGMVEDGLEIPEPSTTIAFCSEDCTGVLNVRVKKSLHYFLIQLAKSEGVSVSHLVNDAIVEKYSENIKINKKEECRDIQTSSVKNQLSEREKKVLDILVQGDNNDIVQRFGAILENIKTLKNETSHWHLRHYDTCYYSMTNKWFPKTYAETMLFDENKYTNSHLPYLNQ